MRIGRFVKGQRVYYVRPLPAAPHRVEMVKCTVSWTRGQKMTLVAVQMGHTIYRRNLVNDPVQPDGARIWADLTEEEARARARQIGAAAIEAKIQELEQRVAEMEAAVERGEPAPMLAVERQSLARWLPVKPHLEMFGMWSDPVPAREPAEAEHQRR